jgi:adenylosuccinate lyase
LLLELTRGGMTREDAYRLVQKNALQAWKEQKDFMELVQGDPEITRVLAKEEIAASCDIRFFFQHVDEIFKRVFAEG